jgi:hypothetical protein
MFKTGNRVRFSAAAQLYVATGDTKTGVGSPIWFSSDGKQWTNVTNGPALLSNGNDMLVVDSWGPQWFIGEHKFLSACVRCLHISSGCSGCKRTFFHTPHEHGWHGVECFARTRQCIWHAHSVIACLRRGQHHRGGRGSDVCSEHRSWHDMEICLRLWWVLGPTTFIIACNHRVFFLFREPPKRKHQRCFSLPCFLGCRLLTAALIGVCFLQGDSL